MRPHRKHRIQHQDTLLSPFCQASVIRYPAPQIIMQFLIDIDKGRRNLHALLHGKTQSVCLSVIMVRILPQDHYFNFM